ncbi:hypothetical protein [Micromonospora sp. DT233]|uniref:hypothetical protein n=1 Tax=Micromonospora sp. DT233 TaxID=3393432 RepID=UPI003CE6B1C0
MEVLKLPVLALKHHGYLKPTDLYEWQSEPEAVGVGSDGTAFAVWPHRQVAERKQVTSHAGGTAIVTSATVETPLKVSFVQPLPGGQLLLAAARSRPDAPPNAQIWTSEGHLVRAGHLGDAIEELLTTPSGDMWVGYFDEAMAGSGPQTHGLARFTGELVPDWLYPVNAGLPSIFDCYTLNVHGEDAYCCPYTDFHLISVAGDVPRDLGPAPYRSANCLLVDGAEGVLIGGWGPEYDLVTPLRLSRQGVESAGWQGRIVLPDGMEAQRLRYTCRGPDLHAFIRDTWYRLALDDLTTVHGL